MTDTCPETVSNVNGFHFRECGRPVKRNGLCGIHAASKKRERNDAARLERKAAAQVIVDRLLAHGVRAYVAWDGNPEVSMGAADLADLLDATLVNAPAEDETTEDSDGE